MAYVPSQDGGVRFLPAGDLLIVSAHASASSLARFDETTDAGRVIYGTDTSMHLLCSISPASVKSVRWIESNGRELGMLHCTEPAYLAYRGGIWIPPGTYTYAERGWRRGL
jgi:hypothetical protein